MRNVGSGAARLREAGSGTACLGLLAMLATAGGAVAQQARLETGGIVRFEEVAKPIANDPSSRKWNWEVQLSPAQSAGRFRIMQETRGSGGPEREYSLPVFTENELQRSAGDPIHFMLRTGDENPTPNLNKQGNVGLGASFTRVGGGFAASSWIVLPGRIVRSEPSRRGRLRNGRLPLLAVETQDPAGRAHHTELLLEATGGPGTTPASPAPAGSDTSGWKSYRSESMGFAMRYPAEWRVGENKGPESVSLMGPRRPGLQPRLVQFWVQRRVNPTGLPIDRWYSEQAKRMKTTSLPSTRPEAIGGRPAVRQEAVGSLGRHFAFFVSLNRTDVFEITISQDDPGAPLDAGYEAILRTVRFTN